MKLGTTYKITYFEELDDFVIAFGGKIRDIQFEKIIEEYNSYNSKINKRNEITYSEEEFRKYNKMPMRKK